MNSGFITPQEAYLLKSKVKELADKPAKSPAQSKALFHGENLGAVSTYTVPVDFTEYDYLIFYVKTGAGGGNASLLIDLKDEYGNAMTYEAQNAIQTSERILAILFTNVGEAGWFASAVQRSDGGQLITNVGYNNLYHRLKGHITEIKFYVRSGTIPTGTTIDIFG